MAIAVWLLYAGDRLLDSRALTAAHTPGIEARHRFHHQHRSAFRTGIAVASVALAALLPTLHAEAIHLYLIEGSFLAGYFLLIHAVSYTPRIPKEFAVGLFFAAATFIPTVARRPDLRVPLLAPALLFAGLCTLNCLFIYAWEHPGDTTTTAHITTRAAVRHLRSLAAILLVAALGLLVTETFMPWKILAAIAASIVLLLILDRCRGRLTPTTLRAAADLALLTPALFLFLS